MEIGEPPSQSSPLWILYKGVDDIVSLGVLDRSIYRKNFYAAIDILHVCSTPFILGEDPNGDLQGVRSSIESTHKASVGL